MGNANSNSVYVQIDKPACLPGDLISGHVHVNIVSMVTCTGLYIKVSGKEWVRLTRHRKKRSHTYSGGRSMFKLQVPLQSDYSESLIGQYTFPFSFRLPLNLPGSASFDRVSGNDSIRAGTTYKVKGVVAIAGMLKSNLRHSQELKVIQSSVFSATLRLM